MLTNRIRFATCFIIFVFLSLGSPLLAEELTPAKEADIKKLLEVTGALNMGFQFGNTLSQQQMQQAKLLRPDIPDRFFDVMREEVLTFIRNNIAEQGGLSDVITAVYNKYYTHQEIKGLLEFYQTELGKKTIKIMPKAMNDTMIAIQQWGQRIGPALDEAVQRRLREEGIEPPKFEFGKKSESEKQAFDAGNKRLSFKDLSGTFVNSKTAGKLFVVKGWVTNKYPDRRSYIRIMSKILDSERAEILSKVVFAGHPFTDKELQTLPLEEINNRLRDKFGKNKMNTNVPPKASIPFVIVFDSLPEDMDEFTVEAVSSFQILPLGRD